MKEMKKILTFIGKDKWSRPVYRDENGKLWKDTDCRVGYRKNLYSALDNRYDGEPDIPMKNGLQCVFVPGRMLSDRGILDKYVVEVYEHDKEKWVHVLGYLYSPCDGTGYRYMEYSSIFIKQSEFSRKKVEEEEEYVKQYCVELKEVDGFMLEHEFLHSVGADNLRSYSDSAECGRYMF